MKHLRSTVFFVALAVAANLAHAQKGFYEIDDASREVVLRDVQPRRWPPLVNLTSAARLTPRVNYFFSQVGELVDPSKRQDFAFFAKEYAQAKATGMHRDELRGRCQQWMDENLTPEDFVVLDRIRMRSAFSRFGLFIFESSEACEIAGIQDSEALRGRIRELRQQLNKEIASDVAKYEYAFLEQKLSRSGFQSLKNAIKKEMK